MKQKLLSGVQNVIFLALISASVLDYHNAMEQKAPPYFSGSKHIENIQKSQIWSGLLHSQLLGSFWVSKDETLEEMKPILNTDNVDISILPFSSYMQFENVILPFKAEGSGGSFADENDANTKTKSAPELADTEADAKVAGSAESQNLGAKAEVESGVTTISAEANPKKVHPLLRAALNGNFEIFKTVYEKTHEKKTKPLIITEDGGLRLFIESTPVYETCSCGMRDYFDGYWQGTKEPKPLSPYLELNEKSLYSNPDLVKEEALMIAAYLGNEDIVNFLISEKTRVTDCWGFIKETPLMLAAQRGHYKVVESLLSAGAKIDKTVCGGDLNALKYALSNGHMDIARLLIEKGAKMETRTSSSYISNLSYAVLQNNKEILELMLEKGAHPKAESGIHYSALEYAVLQNRFDFAKLLLEKGADATGISLLFAVQNKNKEMIKLLVEHGGDPNVKTSEPSAFITHDFTTQKLNHFTEDESIKALLYELGLKDQDSLEDLLFESIDKDGSDTEKILDLIKKGANVNAKNTKGDTPLLFAVKKQPYKSDQIAALINNGADVTFLDKEGKSVLDHFSYFDIPGDLFEQIVQKKPKLNKENTSHYIQMSLRLHSTSLLELMLEQGIELPKKYVEHVELGYEKSFLKTACLSSQKVCAFLLNNGFDVNEKEENENHFILELINFKIDEFENPIDHLRFLVEKGVDLKAVDKHYKKGVLHKLEYLHMKDVLHFLVQNGVDINMKDEDGYTPLMDAVSQHDITERKLDYIKELINLGADVNAKNDDGETALDLFKNPYIRKNETYQEIVDILSKATDSRR